MYKSKKSHGELVVTSGDSLITFEFMKETFNKVPFFILFFVKWNIDFAITSRFNASDCALRTDLVSEFVRIISGVRHHYAGFKLRNESGGNCHIVDLSGSQIYLNGIAKPVGDGMYLGCIATTPFAY